METSSTLCTINNFQWFKFNFINTTTFYFENTKQNTEKTFERIFKKRKKSAGIPTYSDRIRFNMIEI